MNIYIYIYIYIYVYIYIYIHIMSEEQKQAVSILTAAEIFSILAEEITPAFFLPLIMCARI